MKTNDERFRILAATCMVMALSTARSLAAEQPGCPNILLIVADDLGFSDLGCYGGEIATPHLDRLAERGVRLTQFYTMGRCCPSRAAVLTGQYPHRVGLGHMTKDLGMPGYRGRASDQFPTIAELLRPAGYRSFLVGKWHLGTNDPTRRGFEEFYGTLVSAKTFWDVDHFLRMPQGRTPRQYDRDHFYGTDALGDHAIDFLALARQTPGKPWFLYLAFNAPHFPLHAPKETIAKYADAYRQGWDVLRAKRLARMKEIGVVPNHVELTARSLYFDWGEPAGVKNPAWESLPADRRADLARRMAIYAAMIDRMDQNIGRVLSDLRSHGELENTLIVFTSDNGACAEWDPYGFDVKSGPENVLHRGEQIERMGSPGTYHSVGSGWANASNTPWRLYKHYNHEGGIATPGIVSWPAAMESTAGSVNPVPTHLIDLVPTFLNAAGARTPTGSASLPGKSLTPLLRGGELSPRPLFFEHEGNRAVRQGRWKLVALRGEGWELYDMNVDRTERNDLSDRYPKIVKRLSSAWNGWAEENHVTPLPSDYKVEYVKPRSAGQVDDAG